MLKESWGLYPWFTEHGEEMIFSDDLSKFKDLSPYGKVFKCEEENEDYIVLSYGIEAFRVKPQLFKKIPKPAFQIGERVKLMKDQVQEAVIVEVNWHIKNKEHIYYITLNGKKKSSRYKEKDLVSSGGILL